MKKSAFLIPLSVLVTAFLVSVSMVKAEDPSALAVDGENLEQTCSVNLDKGKLYDKADSWFKEEFANMMEAKMIESADKSTGKIIASGSFVLGMGQYSYKIVFVALDKKYKFTVKNINPLVGSPFAGKVPMDKAKKEFDPLSAKLYKYLTK